MGSLNDYPFDETPLRTDPLLGISNHDVPQSWALRRMAVADILALIIDDDIPETIARLSDLTSFLTAAGAATLSNKSFSDRPDFAAGISLAGVNLAATAVQLDTLVSHLALLNAITADSDEINLLDGLLTSTTELNALAGIGLLSTELSILKGALLSTAELNILNGATLTTAELNTLSGFLGTVTDFNNLKSLLDNLSVSQLKTVTVSRGLPVTWVYDQGDEFTDPDIIPSSPNFYIIAPVAGTITRITVVTDEAITTPQAIFTPSISGTNITQGVIETGTGQPAGSVFFSVPTDNRTVTLGQAVKITRGGGVLLHGHIMLHIERP